MAEADPLPNFEQRQALPKPRPLSFWLHSVLGLNLSLFIGFICLTGTIATVSHEIEWLFKPEIRASSSIEPSDWGAMWDGARKEYPDTNFSSIGTYDRSDTRYFTTVVQAFGDGDTEDLEVYVDPVTSHVTGEARGVTFHSFMRGLHYYLFAPTDIPFYIVASMGLVLLSSLVTGLLVYKKFWRGFFKKPRFHRDRRTWMGDVHRLTGLWSLWFVALIGLTSAWYIVERAGLDLNSDVPSTKEAIVGRDVNADDINRWVSAAKSELPGMAITMIGLPSSEGDPIVVQGQWKAWLVRERTNAVFIDPATDAVLDTRIAHHMSSGERLVHTADPLHFGNFGGLASKLFWVLCGLLLTGMAFSGAYIYAKRTRVAVQGGINLSFLNYLGIWKWPSVTAIAVVPAVAFVFW